MKIPVRSRLCVYFHRPQHFRGQGRVLLRLGPITLKFAFDEQFSSCWWFKRPRWLFGRVKCKRESLVVTTDRTVDLNFKSPVYSNSPGVYRFTLRRVTRCIVRNTLESKLFSLLPPWTLLSWLKLKTCGWIRVLCRKFGWVYLRRHC